MNPTQTWADILLGKVRGVHAEIAALHAYLATPAPSDPPLTPAQIEGLFANHYAMLDDLYLNQLPFARAAADDDLFLNYRGTFDPRRRAALSAVDRLFGNVRAQIGSMTRAVAEAEAAPQRAEGETAAPRREIELAVSSYLPGRYVGFTLPEAAEGETEADLAAVRAIQQSLYNLGAVAQCLPDAEAPDRVEAAVDDPQVRDATLGAITKLLPYRDRTVEAIEIRGRALPLLEPASIDRRAWQVAQALLARPEPGAERGAFTGHLLQIDYELHRFDLRWLDDPRPGWSNLRCAYPEALAALCEGLARRKVEVRGTVAYRKGRPRLVHVEAIREIT